MKVLVGFLLVLLMGISTVVQATTISYDLQSIGGNRYVYSYTLTNDTLIVPLDEFTVYFDYTLYGNLAVGSNTPSGWDPQIVQPDNIFGQEMNGFYDAYSLAGLMLGGTASGFTVSFDWLGATAGPSTQPFDIIDPADFSTIYTGTTMFAQHTGATPAPEPGTMLLTAIGLACIGLAQRRMSNC